MMPGAMQLTVMPRVATSAANDFVMPIIAAFAAAYLAWIAGDADDRGNPYDAAVAAAHHAAQRSARQTKSGGEVHIEHRLPILVLHAQGEIVAGNAGIVDEDIELAHRRVGVARELVGGVRVGEIGGEDMRAPRRLGGEFLRERVKRGGARAGERNRR